MKQIAFTIYCSLVIVVIISSCKTTTTITNKETGVKVMLPKNATTIDPVSLEDKFSNKFYHKAANEKYTFKWHETYNVYDDIIIGIAFDSQNPFLDADKRSRELGFVTKNIASDIFKRDTMTINNCDYLLFFYKKKNNENDYFADYYSDLEKAPRVWGTIRFPGTYPLERVKKETYDILSGIKFPKIKTE